MTNDHQNNSLSWGDALFLYLEREGQPINIAGVSVFEGEIKLAECAAFVESKLLLIPRYRQRVVFPPFDLGLPSWEFDPKFKIRNHVREVKLKHGTEQELKALAGKIVSTRLDRQRPLWDFTLARLQGGRTGLVVRIHHCMTDGIAGVGVINTIMDTTPTPAPIPHKKPEVEPVVEQKDPAAIFLGGLAKSYMSLVSGALTLHTGLLNVAQEAVANPTGPPAEMIRMLSEMAAPAERLPFNTICRGPQKFAWTQVPLADIKAVKNTCGGTVNDVILATVTRAFGRYAQHRGVDLKGRSLRIVIPVNVRGNGSATELGNKISFVPVPIPLDIRDPLKLLAVVRERVEFLKHARAAEFVGLFGGLLSSLPSAFWAAAGPVVSQLPLSLCNIICTNVPGPQTPLYLMGHKMLSWYPWVPIGGLMGINCAILTYNGTAFFGFTGDVNAAPDLERLEELVVKSFAELRSGAGAEVVAKPRPPKRERNAKIALIPLAKVPAAKTPMAKTPNVKTRTVRKKALPKTSKIKPIAMASRSEQTAELEKPLAAGA